MSVQQLRWSYWAFWMGPGRAAFRAVFPSYVLLLFLALITFGGNGLQPRTVVQFCWSTPVGGACLLLSWVALTSRAYRAALADPAWALLRTFPLPGGVLLPVASGFVVVVESPWLVLWLTGAAAHDALLALFASLVGSGLWIGATNRVRPRFRSIDAARGPFIVSVLAFVRTLLRQYPLAILLGTGLWVAVTAAVILMLQREHEDANDKRVFGVAAFSLFTIVMITTGRALLQQEERKVRWIFATSEGGNELMVWSPVVAILAVGTCFDLVGCGVALLVAGSERAPWFSVGWPLIWNSLCFGLGFGTLASSLMRVKSSHPMAAHAPLKALLSVLPLFYVAQIVPTLVGAGIAVACATAGLVLLLARVNAGSSRTRDT